MDKLLVSGNQLFIFNEDKDCWRFKCNIHPELQDSADEEIIDYYHEQDKLYENEKEEQDNALHQTN